jgi:hypothetical protein
MQSIRGIVYISKIAAASRQLDAAIRMFFAEEDDLAIHTVASAAFRILRDVTDKRSKNFTDELLRNGMREMARLYVEGNLPKATLESIQKSPSLMRAFEEIAAHGENFDTRHIYFPANTKKEKQERDKRAWPSKPANFLKHADQDPEDHLLADEIKNEHVLIGACLAYQELMKMRTPEITAFILFWAAKNDATIDEEEQEQKLFFKLRSVEESDRYDLCAKYIRGAQK